MQKPKQMTEEEAKSFTKVLEVSGYGEKESLDDCELTEIAKELRRHSREFKNDEDWWHGFEDCDVNIWWGLDYGLADEYINTEFEMPIVQVFITIYGVKPQDEYMTTDTSKILYSERYDDFILNYGGFFEKNC